MKQKITITRVNISSPNGCQVKTENCKEEAYWFVGHLSICDKHLKVFCKLAGIDYEGVLKEARSKGFNI